MSTPNYDEKISREMKKLDNLRNKQKNRNARIELLEEDRHKINKRIGVLDFELSFINDKIAKAEQKLKKISWRRRKTNANDI